MMYAITGITGKVGGELARTLLAAGEPVRAVVSDAKKGQKWAALGCQVALAEMEDAKNTVAKPRPTYAIFSNTFSRLYLQYIRPVGKMLNK
jgi:NAD(P)H dehydrogenase (quinone)